MLWNTGSKLWRESTVTQSQSEISWNSKVSFRRARHEVKTKRCPNIRSVRRLQMRRGGRLLPQLRGQKTAVEQVDTVRWQPFLKFQNHRLFTYVEDRVAHRANSGLTTGHLRLLQFAESVACLGEFIHRVKLNRRTWELHRLSWVSCSKICIYSVYCFHSPYLRSAVQ